MLIYVMPGDIPGEPLALSEALHLIHLRHNVTAMVDSGEDTPASNLARRWADQIDVPTVRHHYPNHLIIAVDISQTLAASNGRSTGNLHSQARQAWQDALQRIQPAHRKFLDRLQILIKDRRTTWVNTAHGLRVPARRSSNLEVHNRQLLPGLS